MTEEKAKRPRYGGRKKEFTERIQLPLRAGTLKRIDASLGDGEVRLDFIREAIEKSLAIRGGRAALPVEAISRADLDRIMLSRVETDHPYSLDDIPELDDGE
jgi:hypothetical protein